jgi:S-formylglutathione hydrolase
MESYLTSELPELVAGIFPIDLSRQGITGHSMGGHGALTLALRHPGTYRSVSAFAPIVAPSQVPWGEKALGRYLGPDRAAWRAHDAVAPDRGRRPPARAARRSGRGRQLPPRAASSRAAPRRVRARRHSAHPAHPPGYDHSYFFISTFMADHLAWHAERLR